MHLRFLFLPANHFESRISEKDVKLPVFSVSTLQLNACKTISYAKVQGAMINSREFSFEPKAIKGGEYIFSIGSAGSTSLILQTLVLPLFSASTPSLIVLEGGTHNPWAPPYDFIEKVFLPVLQKLGASVSISSDRPGFYPAGGGKVKIEISPSKPLGKVQLLSRGSLVRRECRAIVAGLSGDIAKRELTTFKDHLQWSDEELRIEQLANEYGPRNAMLAELHYDEGSFIFSSFGECGVKAEEVAISLAQQVRDFCNSQNAADSHLADQLLLPCIWTEGGSFTTSTPTSHLLTNLALIKEFVELDCKIECCLENITRIDIN